VSSRSFSGNVEAALDALRREGLERPEGYSCRRVCRRDRHTPKLTA
jgi:hypothetical protein